MADTQDLQRTLFSEMKSRMPAKISTPPERWGPWFAHFPPYPFRIFRKFAFFVFAAACEFEIAVFRRCYWGSFDSYFVFSFSVKFVIPHCERLQLLKGIHIKNSLPMSFVKIEQVVLPIHSRGEGIPGSL